MKVSVEKYMEHQFTAISKGMDHNSGTLRDEQDIDLYTKRDLYRTTRDQRTTLPYSLERNEAVGRHMVAARDIKAGEVIFVEQPLNFGPSENTVPVCLGCYAPVSPGGPVCADCGFPLCSPICGQVSDHKDYECRLLTEAKSRGASKVKVDAFKFSYEGPEPLYNIISPLRLYMMSKSELEADRSKWILVWTHMSHRDARSKSPYWTRRTAQILDTITKFTGISEKSDLDLFEVIMGIQLVNDFEMPSRVRSHDESFGSDGSSLQKSQPAIRALYALASMPSHSCVANCTHDFSSRENGFRMTMRSVVPIKKGQEITHSYSQPLDPVLTRRSLLLMGKFFQCSCPRCQDPTELGTFSSAIACRSATPGQKGCQGFVVSSDPSDLEAAWQCQGCHRKVDWETVGRVTQRVKSAAEDLESRISSPDAVAEHEAFLANHSGKELHPNHVFLVEAKYSLAKMYGRLPGFEADQLSDQQLQRKRTLCQEVLAVLDKILPGRTRKRGMMMYELHLPLVLLSNRALQRGPGSGVDPEKIKADLKAGLFNLRIGLEILKDEPEGTFEHKIVQGSTESLKQLEEWVAAVSSRI